MNKQLNQGVTLIELMVVVTIVAILAGITIPTYRQTVIRSNRTEAKSALMEVSQSLEKCYTRWNDYSSPNCPPTARSLTNYDISLAVAATATTYSLQAVPKAGGGQANDTKCGTLTLNQLGIRGKSGSGSVAECW